MVGALTLGDLVTVRAVHPEAVEEVTQDGAQDGTDDRTGDERGLRGAQVQHVGAKGHAAGLNHDAQQVDDAEFDGLALPVFGAGFAEGPQAVHKPREDGGHDTCDDLCLRVGLRHDGHHENPHGNGIHHKRSATDGSELKHLDAVAVPQGFQSFGHGGFSLCAHAGPI